MEIIPNVGIDQKVANYFYCKICDYNTSKKFNYEKHLQTDKHKKATVSKQEIGKVAKVAMYCCQQCGQKYLSQSGLWKHSKKCNINGNENIDNTEHSDKQIIMMLIKDNSEIKNMMLEQQKYMMELVKNGTHNTINNNCGNNNKTFNLQVFLNETCKDAINMSDFINQLQISLSDLEETGKIGYAEGISKVFIKNLNEINYTNRPIHCSDSKREILYIKEDNKWTKDDDQKTSLTKAIKHVAHKNIKQISEWQKLHPDFSNPDSKQNDKYMNIVLNSMSGSTKEESDKNYEKIAKNVIKEVVIEKG
jgi:hypothetical protein